jgi:C1A family cysteine protease
MVSHIFLFIFAAVASATTFNNTLPFNGVIVDKFNEWITNYHIKIADNSHLLRTYSAWRFNNDFIDEHNSKNLSYQLGHNQYSGMLIDEFRQQMGFANFFSTHKKAFIQSELNYPDSIDWANAGAVTPVKDQGQCGSCWSFSTTGALETAYFLKYNTLFNFSEQQLVDCDNIRNGGHDLGCNGGLMDSAFSWITKNGGLCTEETYPYVSGDTTKSGTCQKSCKIDYKSKILDYIDITPSSDEEMMNALAKQTVAIAIQADQIEFQLYKSGVFTGACGTTLDHGVLAVGYGSTDNHDFYKVKNSWGETWGSNGYILLGRGSQYNNGDGQCGMLLEASYPVL